MTTIANLFHESIYNNDVDSFNLLFVNPSISQDHLAKGFYLACSMGNLLIVKLFLESSIFQFDSSFHGCSVQEFGIQASCHKEGKSVFNYIINHYNVVLSEKMERWMIQNKLDKKLNIIKSKYNNK